MRDMQVLMTAGEVHEFVGQLWRTEEFAESHREEGGYVREVVEILARRPVIFFSMEDSEVEWSQFTTWMGAYALRPGYENDAVHDLYFLHEFLHGATMAYDGAIPFVQWHRKMCENEMLASVHSEAYVYFRLPTLREKSFGFEIWVDRFLADPARLGRALEGPLVKEEGVPEEDFPVFQWLRQARREVMKSPDPFDFLEMQIHYYAMQNMQWSNIWRGRYREVEGHMAAYVAGLEEDPAAAVEQHLAWLMDQKGQGVTPFQDEAEAFAKIVKDNKKRQGNELLKA